MADLAKVTASLTAEKAMSEKLKKDLVTAQTTLNTKNTENDKIKKDLAAAQTALKTEKDAGAKIKAELQASQTALTTEKAASEKFKKDITVTQTALNTEKTGSEQIKKDLTAAQTALKTEKDAGAKITADLQASQTALTTEKATNEKLQKDLTATQTALNTEKTGSEQIKKDLAAAQTALKTEKDAGAKISAELQASQTALTTEKATSEKLKKDLTVAQTTLNTEQDAGKKQKIDLESKLSVAQTALKSEQESVQKLKSELEAALNKLKIEQENFEKEQKLLQDKIEQLQQLQQQKGEINILQNLDDCSESFQEEIQCMGIVGKNFDQLINQKQKISNFEKSKISLKQIAITGTTNVGKKWFTQSLLKKKIQNDNQDSIINVLQDKKQRIQVILNKHGIGKNFQMEEQKDCDSTEELQQDKQQYYLTKQIIEQQNFDHFVQSSIINNKELGMCIHIVSDFTMESQKSILQAIELCPKNVRIYIILNLKFLTNNTQIKEFKEKYLKNIVQSYDESQEDKFSFQATYKEKKFKYMICANNKSQDGSKYNEKTMNQIRNDIENEVDFQKKSNFLAHFCSFFNENIQDYLNLEVSHKQQQLIQEEQQKCEQQTKLQQQQVQKSDEQMQQKLMKESILTSNEHKCCEESNSDDEYQSQIQQEKQEQQQQQQQQQKSLVIMESQTPRPYENQSYELYSNRSNRNKDLNIWKQKTNTQTILRMEYLEEQNTMQVKYNNESVENSQIPIFQTNLHNFQFGVNFINNSPHYLIYQKEDSFVIFLNVLGIQNINNYFTNWESEKITNVKTLVLTGTQCDQEFDNMIAQEGLQKLQDDANMIKKGFFRVKIPLCSWDQNIDTKIKIDRDQEVLRNFGMIRITIMKK